MFALASIRHNEAVYSSVKIGDFYWPLHVASQKIGLDIPDNLADIFKEWSVYHSQVVAVADAAVAGKLDSGIALHESSVQLVLPLHYPNKVFCTGANYADHLEEMGATMEKNPVGPFFYLKPASSALTGPGKSVYIPTGCANFDWEAEMVVVFGRGGRNIPKDKALDCVAGYMLGVDFTARDQMAAPPPFVFDFTLGKCQDRTAPVGPYVVPKEFVDGADIHFSLSVNGVQKQSTTTAKMIYSLQEQISGISKRVQIEPGDIMFTGSPAGVGAAHNESAHAGDLIVLSSPQLGELRVTLGSAPSTYQPV